MRSYVFPGQGHQKKGMGRSLFGHFPGLCRRADDVLGYSVQELCSDDPERLLNKTEYSQPAIYVVNALHYLMECRKDLPPADYVAGHSLGEYNALFAAGAFDFETGLTLVKHRAELMGKADGGGMAAVVGLSEDLVAKTLTTHGSEVVIANFNAPEQFVLSGGKDELERMRPIFEQIEGIRGFAPLRVSGAFHSPRMELAAKEFREFLQSFDFGELQTPVISNVTGLPVDSGEHAIREALAQQITAPVRWTECIRYMRNAGVSDFVELGQSKVLTSLIDKITAVEQHAGEQHAEEQHAEEQHAEEQHAEEQRAGEQHAGGQREDVIARIKREILQPEVGDTALQFDPDQSFRQLGLDSIVYVRLARKVEAVFGIPFKPDVMYANRTCAALADYLLAKQGTAKSDSAAPLAEYRDERVLALLRDCASGTRSVDQVIDAIRAGGVPAG